MSIVNLSMCSFGLTSVAESPKNFAKLRTIFQTTKFFLNFFSSFFSAAGSRPRPCLSGFQSVRNPGLSSRRDLRPKSECKVRHFLPFHQIFQQEFCAEKHSFTKHPAQPPVRQQFKQMLKIRTIWGAKMFILILTSKNALYKIHRILPHAPVSPPQQASLRPLPLPGRGR